MRGPDGFVGDGDYLDTPHGSTTYKRLEDALSQATLIGPDHTVEVVEFSAAVVGRVNITVERFDVDGPDPLAGPLTVAGIREATERLREDALKPDANGIIHVPVPSVAGQARELPMLKPSVIDDEIPF